MLGERFFEIDIVLSLCIILGVLGAAIVASVIWPRSATPDTDATSR